MCWSDICYLENWYSYRWHTVQHATQNKQLRMASWLLLSSTAKSDCSVCLLDLLYSSSIYSQFQDLNWCRPVIVENLAHRACECLVFDPSHTCQEKNSGCLLQWLENVQTDHERRLFIFYSKDKTTWLYTSHGLNTDTKASKVTNYFPYKS